jgi:hypothetical protein
MIQIDWRLPLLECNRDPGKTMDKKVKRQVLKYMSLDDDLYRRTIDSVLLKCCHTQYLCQNQVLIVCTTQYQFFHTYGQKCS